MRSTTLKWVVLTGTVIIGMIIAIQLYWLNHIYNLEKKQFNTNVVKSIRGLYEDADISYSPSVHLHQLISQPNANTFLIKADNIFNQDTLVFYLTHELVDFDVLTDCKLAIYDSGAQRYNFEGYIPTPASREVQSVSNLPVYHEPYNYILLNFPHRSKYILSQMNFWILSSIFLMLILIGLAISMFYFYKQKFLVEVQKDFVNNFTHEFKTPLAVMKIASEVLSQPNISSQQDRLIRYAGIIKSETKHLQEQVERLLNMAVSEKKDLAVDKQVFAVREIIDQAVSKLQPLMEERDVKVELKLEDEKSTITADREHLELAVVNLIENGIKYSSHPHIVIEAGRMGSESFIAIRDNGIGIDKRYHRRIFQKFYRVPTGDVHNVKGFGLGLNFVKKIVDAHHGRILVSSVPGIGTEFRIVIPN
jgi:two-component system phosphate regulon sensor histidine kinase PhoR